MSNQAFLSMTPKRLFHSSRGVQGERQWHVDPTRQLSEEEQLRLVATSDQSVIRNFSIIAHIDHGKSTLADRLLELSGNVAKIPKDQAQILDKLQVERERGITVKAQTASMFYRDNDAGQSFLLNLIDTPGHVDFSYEVSRSLAACQGALLLVDSARGVQAQTLANYYLALEQNLDIIPIISKIDLPVGRPDWVLQQLESAFGIDPQTVLRCSSKSGLGIQEVFPAIVNRIRAPAGRPNPAPLRALLFDSWYDSQRGVVCLVNVVDGEIKTHDRVGTYHSGGTYDVVDVGLLMPYDQSTGILRAGQVGYVTMGMRTTREARLGDTFYYIGNRRDKASVSRDHAIKAKTQLEPLPGFKPAKCMVFAGLFPSSSIAVDELVDAMEKLTLNDPSVHVEKDTSEALGLGFRCGFLGILHMDVFSSRLEQEFGAPVIITAPTVSFKAEMKDGAEFLIDNPSKFPDPFNVTRFFEPMVRASIITPQEFVGPLGDLCLSCRGVLEDISPFSSDRMLLRFKLPLAEIVTKFYDAVKSISSGYASLDYDELGYQEAALTKLEIRVNGEAVDALSVICESSRAQERGRDLCAKLAKAIQRQSYEVVVQAAISNRVIARERIAPFRKDVLTKGGKTVGGGDETRKRKLLDKQKEGKRRMKMIGNVELDQDVFLAVLGTDDLTSNARSSQKK